MIEKIKFQGKEYPFLFGWSAYKEYIKFATSDKVDFVDLPEKGMHLGFVCGAKKEGIKVFTIDKMVEMFDDDPGFHERVAEVWNKYMGIQRKIQDKIMKGVNP